MAGAEWRRPFALSGRSAWDFESDGPRLFGGVFPFKGCLSFSLSPEKFLPLFRFS